MVKLFFILAIPCITFGQYKSGSFVLTEEIKKRINYADFEGETGYQYFLDLPVESLSEFATKLMSIPPEGSDGNHFGYLVSKYIQFQDSIQEPLKSKILAVIKAKAYNTNGSTDPKGFLISWEVNAHTLTPIKDPEIQAIVADLRRKVAEARAEHIRSQGIDPDSMLPIVTVPTPKPQVNIQSEQTRKPSPSPKQNLFKSPNTANDSYPDDFRRNSLLALVGILILVAYFFYLRKKRRAQL